MIGCRVGECGVALCAIAAAALAARVHDREHGDARLDSIANHATLAKDGGVVDILVKLEVDIAQCP